MKGLHSLAARSAQLYYKLVAIFETSAFQALRQSLSSMISTQKWSTDQRLSTAFA